MSLLYHYCSLDAFCQITRRSTIRFSDITKSNDSDEIKFMFDIYVRYLENRYRDVRLPDRDSLNEEIRKTLDSIKIYCFCLSKSEDDLSQWRGYAPGGGVSIGFDPDMLAEYAESISVPDEQVRLEKVEYMDKDDSSGNFPYFERGNYDHSSPADNIAEILKISPQFKNIGFQAENEYRLYFPKKLPPAAEEPLPCVYVGGREYPVDYKLSENGSMKSFYEIPFPFEMVKKIWIGPKLLQSGENIRSFVKRYHPSSETEILRTELTYR